MSSCGCRPVIQVGGTYPFDETFCTNPNVICHAFPNLFDRYMDPAREALHLVSGLA